MNARRALCLVLAALCALQPVAPALADGTASTLAPAQIDQLLADRYGPLAYQPQADCVAPRCAASLGAAVPLQSAAASGGDAAASTASIWVIVAIVVVIAVVAGSGGGGGGGY